jgi:hypothetical protein
MGATSTSGVVDSDAGGEGMVSPNVANRMADGKGMEWTKEALADLNRRVAPFVFGVIYFCVVYFCSVVYFPAV